MIEPQSAQLGASAWVWNETRVLPRFSVTGAAAAPLSCPFPLPVACPLVCPFAAITANSSFGELKVLATNGHAANGHAANGNGKAVSNGNGGSVAPITLNLGGAKVSFQTQADAPSCAECGSIMVRNGSCYKCLNCGSTSGCS